MTRTPTLSPAQHEEIRAAYRDGATTYDLARRYGCSDVAIGNALRRIGEPLRKTPNKLPSWNPQNDAMAIQMYKDGATVKGLARHFGVRSTVISELLARENVKLKPGGRAHPTFRSATECAKVGAEYAAGATLTDLCKRYGCTTMAIKRALRVSETPLRRAGRSTFWTDEKRAWAAEQYVKGRTQAEIAKELGCSPSAVSGCLKATGVISTPQVSGSKHHSYKGGRCYLPGGYVSVLVHDEDRPFCTPGATNRTPEHRLVMGRHLGRPLREDETIHHINGVRDDNRIENLQLRSGNHGKGAVRRCADCGSHNIEDVPL